MITAGVLAAAVIAVTAAAAPGDAAPRDGYCRKPVLRSYERQLQALPGIVDLPASGLLPFGPSWLRVGRSALPPNRGRVVTGGGSFGYFIEGRPRVTPLEWNVSSRLSQLDSRGAIVRAVDEASGYVAEVSNIVSGEFMLQVPMQSGPYRYDMTFADRTGQLLGTYGQYLSVVRPKLSARLGIKKRSLHAGGVLISRLENLGTEAVEDVANRPSIFRRVGAHWRFVPGEPVGPGILEGDFVAGGTAGGCSWSKLGRDLKPGRYRVVSSLRLIRLGGSGEEPTLTRSAEFTIH